MAYSADSAELRAAVSLLSARVAQLESWLLAANLQPVPAWAAAGTRRRRVLRRSVTEQFDAATRDAADKALQCVGSIGGIVVPAGLTDPDVPTPVGLNVPQLLAHAFFDYANHTRPNEYRGHLLPHTRPPDVLLCALTAVVCRGGLRLGAAATDPAAARDTPFPDAPRIDHTLTRLLDHNTLSNWKCAHALMNMRVFEEAEGVPPPPPPTRPEPSAPEPERKNNGPSSEGEGEARDAATAAPQVLAAVAAVTGGARDPATAAAAATPAPGTAVVHQLRPWHGLAPRAYGQHPTAIHTAVHNACLPMLEFFLSAAPSDAFVDDLLNAHHQPPHQIPGLPPPNPGTSTTMPPSAPGRPCPVHEHELRDATFGYCGGWHATAPLHVAILRVCEAPIPAAWRQRFEPEANGNAWKREQWLQIARVLLRRARDDGSGVNIDAAVSVVGHTPGSYGRRAPPTAEYRPATATVSLTALVDQCLVSCAQASAEHRAPLLALQGHLQSITSRRRAYRDTLQQVLQTDGRGVGDVPALRQLIAQYAVTEQPATLPIRSD